MKPRVRAAIEWCHAAAWLMLLRWVHSPWTELGGLVDERLRWWERFLTFCGWGIGFLIAGAEVERRQVLYGLWGGAAAGMSILSSLGFHDAVGVVTSLLVALTAGGVAGSIRPARERPARPVARRSAGA